MEVNGSNMEVLLVNSAIEEGEEEVQTKIEETGNTNTASISKKTAKRKEKNGRHGARNQHRHKSLCKWIIERYPALQEGDLVVDVAGGKGELAARLTMCHKLHVLLIDPRQADIHKTFTNSVLPKLPKRHQARFQERTKETPKFLEQILEERFQQLDICFDESTVQSNQVLRDALTKCKLIIGMHADGATECIVDVALQFQKPFVVIPCCVFPNLFRQRFVMDVVDDKTGEEKRVQVRSHEQFCRYLHKKDCRFQREVLPFEGRNVSILWDGEECHSTSQLPDISPP